MFTSAAEVWRNAHERSVMKGGFFTILFEKLYNLDNLSALFPLEVLHPLEYYLPQLGPDVHPQREGLLETYEFDCLLYKEVQLDFTPKIEVFHAMFGRCHT